MLFLIRSTLQLGVGGVKEEGSQLLVLSQLMLCILESSILKSFNIKDWDVLKARALPAHEIVEGFGNL